MWRRREAEWEREKVAREKLMNEVSIHILDLAYSLVPFFLKTFFNYNF